MDRLALGVAAACMASLLYDLGLAMQALEAREVPAEHSLRLSLLGRLLRRPLWLGGTVVALLGFPLQVLALGWAPLTVVQPALAVGLLLLLAIGVRRLGEHVGRREVTATLAIVAGVTGIALAAPEHTTHHAGGATLAAGLGALGLLCLLPYARRSKAGGSFAVALAAGGAYAWSGISSKLLADQLSSGTALAAAVWLVATALVAGLGMLSEMTALQRHPATRVAPAVFSVQVVVPVLLAPALGGESWSSTPLSGGLLLALLALVALGATALGRSPAVARLVEAS
jgi:drug/metabolite transporter (DMT)-like permease